MDEATIIRKLNEITRWIEGVKLSSKPIHELTEIEGDEFWMAVSNGVKSGKKKVDEFQMPDLSLPYKWHLTDLTIGQPITISNEKLNFDLTINDSSVLNGFNGTLNDGLVGSIHNNTNQPITLLNNYSGPDVTIPMTFSSGVDYVLQPNETLSYKFSESRNQIEMSVYDTTSFVRPLPFFDDYKFTEIDILQDEITIKLTNKPNTLEHVFVMCNGQNISPRSYYIDEDILVIVQSEVEYTFKANMKIVIFYMY